MHEKKKFRTGLSLIVSFFLAVFLFLLCLSVELKTGYFSEREFQKAIRSSSYGANMEEALIEKLKILFAEQQLPESLVEDIVEEMDVYVLFHNYVDKKALGNGGTESIKIQEEFQDRFRTALNTYLEEQEVYETESIENSVELLAKQAGAICERYLYPGFVSGYYDMSRTVQKQLVMLAVIAVVFSVICAATLLGMYHYKHRALRYMAYSTIAATLLNIAGIVHFRCTDVLKVTGVEPEYYQQFLELHRVQGLNSWYLVSGAGIGITVVLLMLIKHLKHTVK